MRKEIQQAKVDIIEGMVSDCGGSQITCCTVSSVTCEMYVAQYDTRYSADVTYQLCTPRVRACAHHDIMYMYAYIHTYIWNDFYCGLQQWRRNCRGDNMTSSECSKHLPSIVIHTTYTYKTVQGHSPMTVCRWRAAHECTLVNTRPYMAHTQLHIVPENKSSHFAKWTRALLVTWFKQC